MRAALLIRPGEIRIGSVPDPEPGPGEVRIAVEGVGLCGSDQSVYRGSWAAPAYPWILGHEAFGRIDSVGAGVPARRVGETVVVEPNVPCLACDSCLRGWTSACTSRQSVGMNRPGGLAELLVVPDRFAWSMSGAAPDLVCVEPTTVVLAALRRLGGDPAGPVLVVGAGAQGMLMMLVLLHRGIEVAGTIVVLGLDSRPIGVTAQALVRRQATVRGSLTYDHPDDFQASIDLIGAGGLRPARIVTTVHDLGDAQKAFERGPQVAGKTWIRVSRAP